MFFNSFFLFDRIYFLSTPEILIPAANLCGSSPWQEEVRPQDTVSVIGGVAGSSKQGRKAAWKFVRDNWEELYNRYQGGFLISRLIKVKQEICYLPRRISRSLQLLRVRFNVHWLQHIYSSRWIKRNRLWTALIFSGFVCSSVFLLPLCAAHSRWICYWQNGSRSEGESSIDLPSYILQSSFLFLKDCLFCLT